MINKPFNKLTDSDWSKIIKEINRLFQTEVLLPTEETIISFFVNVLKNENEFQLLKIGDLPEKVEIIYSPSDAVMSWLRASADSETYDYEALKNEPEIDLDSYSFYIGDELAQKAFNNLNVDYSEEFEDEVEDAYAFWDDKFELEVNFAKKCWQQALKRTNKSVIGIFVAGDGSNSEIILNK
ncbi:hypothetical protein [Winogradskyella jejuensis]|uniref:DUF4303 domain-containing protein n=1 Tax=Winogradskyella jejuensis TaxID=1089305 RepID=A0A1M5T397_9FLAO|nr:hypothetical protein [Winogradskyella jejuensis]SHH45090.1 hypothetical protein SAMN05444148_2045 [Winogradskyella jejuensis]